jgi:hypothetical protein
MAHGMALGNHHYEMADTLWPHVLFAHSSDNLKIALTAGEVAAANAGFTSRRPSLTDVCAKVDRVCIGLHQRKALIAEQSHLKSMDQQLHQFFTLALAWFDPFQDDHVRRVRMCAVVCCQRFRAVVSGFPAGRPQQTHSREGV